jgi:hypothetical protein
LGSVGEREAADADAREGQSASDEAAEVAMFNLYPSPFLPRNLTESSTSLRAAMPIPAVSTQPDRDHFAANSSESAAQERETAPGPTSHEINMGAGVRRDWSGTSVVAADAHAKRGTSVSRGADPPAPADLEAFVR